MMRVAIVGVLLAAGQSRRFGINKLLRFRLVFNQNTPG